ncbi:MAG: EamA family transporter [Pseudomonadota bacterium]|nr:EamA family transporter [Pseudomonadota bacterium]
MGIWAAIGAALLFGISTPIAKTLVGEASPLLLAGLLYTGSGIGLAILLAARALGGGRASITWPGRRNGLWLLGATFFGGAVGPYLLMYGLRLTDSASASLILNLEGVFTALLAWFVFKENFDRRIALGMALIIAGGVVLSVGPVMRASGFAGPLAIAGACLAWAVDNNFTRNASVSDAMVIACAKGIIAGPISVALALGFGAPMPNAGTALRAGMLGFAGYGLSLTLFVIALRNLGTARTGAYFSLAPFIGAALAVALGAPLSGSLTVAGLLMAAGVWLHLSERHGHRHHHPTLAHEHPHRHDIHHQHSHDDEWQGQEPHSHSHVHDVMDHEHPHYPDIHHRHQHRRK